MANLKDFYYLISITRGNLTTTLELKEIVKLLSLELF